jgi:uncharacterized protein DUF1996
VFSGTSHSHDFFGNSSTNANSTLKSLLAAGTSCSNRADTAADWVPTLAVNGKAVTPKLGPGLRPGRGPGTAAAAVSGRPANAGRHGQRHHTPAQLDCDLESCPGPGQRVLQRVPSCGGAHLKLAITFPDCWNGTTLDSADHADHMASSVHGACPASHPVALPRLEVSVKSPVASGQGVMLAGGAPLSAHGDFFNAWDQATLTSLVRGCLNAGKLCGPG